VINACSYCSGLKPISFPAFIEILWKYCFSNGSSLSQIIFESGGQLTEMVQGGVSGCPSLSSICNPAKVETIQEACLDGAHRLRKYRSSLIRN
jgi:hypothetical protein